AWLAYTGMCLFPRGLASLTPLRRCCTIAGTGPFCWLSSGVHMRRTLIAAALAATMAFPVLGNAKTLRWASQGDILTLDPHAQNEGLTIAASSYVYEPLVQYNPEFQVSAGLATAWEQIDPTTWRFKLRE